MRPSSPFVFYIVLSVQTLVNQDIQAAAELLRAGEVVAIPTETVYGLAAHGLDAQAVTKIFVLKGRPAYDPVILHTDQLDKVANLVNDFPDSLLALAQKFWPGPLTLLLPRSVLVPDVVTAGLPRVGIRIPAHPLTLKLLTLLDFPLAAPSANPFGYVSPTRPEHVRRHFDGRIPLILDGGACTQGIESTIVGLEDNDIVVYRLGSLALETIEEVVGHVILRTHSTSRPDAPGMLTKHYAPHKRVMVSDNLALTQAYQKDPGFAFITFSYNLGLGPRSCWLSSSLSLDEAAANFYHALQTWDENPTVHTIIIEKFPDSAQGKALNDKLRRASA